MVAMGLVRILRGPEDADRMMATQLFGTGGIAALLLLGVAACVLLVACANVANLLLARTAGRGQELAVRAALGAGRDRLARQLVTEALLIAALGCVAGLALAWASRPLMTALWPASLPPLEGLRLSLSVLALSVLVTSASTRPAAVRRSWVDAPFGRPPVFQRRTTSRVVRSGAVTRTCPSSLAAMRLPDGPTPSLVALTPPVASG